jgi:hypothetical protein
LNRIHRAALELQEVCRKEGWRFCFIGALAVQRWGEPRATVDADLAILTGYGGEERLATILLKRFHGRIENAGAFAVQNRVLLLESDDGVPLDVSLAATDFEARMIGRATAYRAGEGVELVTSSAEDLVVMKAFADRDRDWIDVRGIIVRQGAILDRDLILRELVPLLEAKEDTAPATRLKTLFAAIQR